MKNLYFVLLVCFFFNVQAQTEKDYVNASQSVQYQTIATYDVKRLDQILSTELNEFLSSSPMPYASFKGSFASAKYPVKLYRVKYRSVVPEWGNKPTETNGLVAIPETRLDAMPMVSYQHGTVFSKNQVPSFPENSMETRMMIAQFAAQGYIVIGADYFGMGTSDLPNSYLAKRSTEQAMVDMLFAAQEVLAAKKIRQGPLFIHGWSQGGWNNMAFLRKLESLNIPVTAASTASAPVDGFATLERWINNYQPIDAVYLPASITYILFAKEYYGRMPGLAASAIRPEYYQHAKDFYDFKIDWPTFLKLTAAKAKDFLKPEFMATGNIGENPFWQIMDDLQAYRWRCNTPLINYYGEKDEVVPVYIAKLPEGFHNLFGSGSTKAESAGVNADHRATYTYSIIHAKQWYDSFLKQK